VYYFRGFDVLCGNANDRISTGGVMMSAETFVEILLRCIFVIALLIFLWNDYKLRKYNQIIHESNLEIAKILKEQLFRLELRMDRCRKS